MNVAAERDVVMSRANRGPGCAPRTNRQGADGDTGKK
jgi:hypothetical protein